MALKHRPGRSRLRECGRRAWRLAGLSSPLAFPLDPPHTILLGHTSAPAPSDQYHAWRDMDWRLVSCMILYMFQCHSPKSSPPLPLPQSPKDCSIHLCLFCCLAYRVIVINYEDLARFNDLCAWSLSHVWLFATPRIVAHQAPRPMGIL